MSDFPLQVSVGSKADMAQVASIIEKAFQDVAFKITKPGDQADRYEAALRDIRRIVTDERQASSASLNGGDIVFLGPET